MNDKKVILAFLLGAAAGTAVSWTFLKKKYERIAQEEIDSVKETFGGFGFVDDDDLEELLEEEDAQWDRVEEAAAEIKNEGPTIKEYAAKLAEEGYTEHSEQPTELEEEEVESMANANFDAPHEIPVEEFGMGDYELSSLTLYADGVVTDDFDDVVDNPASMIGQDNLNDFAESEREFVYIRNDENHTEYELQRTDERYSDREDA